jgi:SurA-like protein
MRLQIADVGVQVGVALIVAAFVPGILRAETIDRVLAVVAGQLITLTDVTAATDLGLQTPDGAADPVRAVLNKLIDRELVLAEVDRYAPAEPTTEAVSAEIARVRQRFASAADFDAALARSGIDEAHLRETLRQDLRMRAYLDQRFSANANRRPDAVDEWMASLRRRGGVVDLYLAGR